jgi:hypothetical protein
MTLGSFRNLGFEVQGDTSRNGNLCSAPGGKGAYSPPSCQADHRLESYSSPVDPLTIPLLLRLTMTDRPLELGLSVRFLTFGVVTAT